MWGSNNKNSSNDTITRLEKDRLKLRKEQASINGDNSSASFTKRELIALEVFKRLDHEDFDDDGAAEYAVERANELLFHLSK